MDDAIISNSELQYLFEELRNRQINHSLRVCTAAHVQGVVDAIAKKARQLGATGLNDLRGMLRPESKSESWDNLGAAQALVILEDGASLGLVIYQAAKLWDQRLVGRLFIDFLEAARELIPHTLKTGPLHEGVIKTLLIFTENILDEGACGSIFEASAVTGNPQLKEALIKAASQSVYQGMLQGSKEDWKRRSKALFALRHYPDMQATMLEAMNHPQDDFAEAAARAMVEMLGILQGCKEKNFNLWKESAMERVPLELKPKIGKGLTQRLRGELVYDYRQSLFWSACEQAHDKAMHKYR